MDTHHPDPIDVYVGARLRDRRKTRALSQEQLGKALGVTFQQVQKYERGTNRISASMLVRAAGFLDTSLDYFVEGMPEAYGRPGKTAVDPELAERARRLDVAVKLIPQVLLIPDLPTAQRSAIRAIIDACHSTLSSEEQLLEQHREFMDGARPDPAAVA